VQNPYRLFDSPNYKLASRDTQIHSRRAANIGSREVSQTRKFLGTSLREVQNQRRSRRKRNTSRSCGFLLLRNDSARKIGTWRCRMRPNDGPMPSRNGKPVPNQFMIEFKRQLVNYFLTGSYTGIFTASNIGPITANP
jgi:hypothetical protein